MKISVCGKGGSGKSVVVALLAGGAQSTRLSASWWSTATSLTRRSIAFSASTSRRSPFWTWWEARASSRRRCRSGSPPVSPSPRCRCCRRTGSWSTEIPARNVRHADGLTLVSIGKIQHSLEGCACPMGVLSSEFLGKLSLGDKEIAVVDMEAGIEHFGRGVGTSMDAVLIVVEPSFESLELASRIAKLAAESGVRRTSAVLNKVASPEMESEAHAGAEDERDRACRYCAIRSRRSLRPPSRDDGLGEGTASEDIAGIVDALLAEA